MIPIRALFVGKDAICSEFQKILAELSLPLEVRMAPPPEQKDEFTAALLDVRPAILFLDYSDLHYARTVQATIQKHLTSAVVVAFMEKSSAEALLEAFRDGVQDFILLPLQVDEIKRSLQHVIDSRHNRQNRSKVSQPMVSVLPAKAGAGGSTVALHTSAAMAELSGNKVALLDFDFEAGALDFMMKLPFGFGIKDIAPYGKEIDQALWERATSRWEKLDVLRSGNPSVHTSISVELARHLLWHARKHYEAICVDLPSSLDEVSMAVLEMSDKILLVCTPDPTTLHMARRRLLDLEAVGLKSKVEIILNRAGGTAVVAASDVEEIVNGKVAMELPNAYEQCQTAVMRGRTVDAGSLLGRRYTLMACRLLGQPEPKAKPSRSLLTTLRGLFVKPKPEPKPRLLLPPAQLS